MIFNLTFVSDKDNQMIRRHLKNSQVSTPKHNVISYPSLKGESDPMGVLREEKDGWVLWDYEGQLVHYWLYQLQDEVGEQA